MYLWMPILQLSVVYLAMILWACVLAFFPMLAISSIHVCISAGLMDRGGMLGFWMSCRIWMSGSLWKCV